MEFNKGGYGENIARGYLESQGYEVLRERYKRAGGEIDLIARKEDTLVFAEVKLRKTAKAGWAAEAVTLKKRRGIINTALRYIAESPDEYGAYRFDVIEVFGAEFFAVNHIENAFYAE